MLASTSISFDLSVFEIFVPLAWGGAVILAENALALPAPAGRGRGDAGQHRPLGAGRAAARPAACRRRCGRSTWRASRCRRALVARLYAAGPAARLYNLYGPSEDTTYSTFAAAGAAGGREPPIGRPLAGTPGLRARPPRCEPVPAGVPGRALPRRRRARPRLPRPAGPDGRALRPRSVRRPSRARASTAPATWPAGGRTATWSSSAASTTR